MIALCLPNDQVNADGTAKRGYWHEQFGKKAGSSVSKGQTKAPIPASYIGGTPANHYRPDYNYRVVEDHQYKHTHENTATEKKIFVRSGGKVSRDQVLSSFCHSNFVLFLAGHAVSRFWEMQQAWYLEVV